jgi:hypothetical protein
MSQALRPGGSAIGMPWVAGEAATLTRTIDLKEQDVAGKKREKSLTQTDKKTAGKPKRPKKTSRGK